MRWDDFVARYLQDASGRGLSGTTRATYRRTLAHFAAYLAQLGLMRVQDILPEHLQRYRDEQAGHRTAASLKSELRLVLIALRWAWRQGILLLNPVQGFVLGRVEPRPAAQFTPAQLAQLLEVRWEGSPQGLRDRAILELFYGTGLRLGEAAALDLADLDLGARQLHVRRSKNGESRLVPLGSRLCERLQVYLTQARPWLESVPQNALWLSPRGRRLTSSPLGLVVVRAGRLVGLQVTAHDLRRAYATHLLAGGARLAELQALLGHRDPATTGHYAEVSPKALARELRRTHPRARRRPRKPRD